MNYEDVQKLSNAAKNKIGLLNGNFLKYFLRAVMAGFFIDVAVIYSNVIGSVFSGSDPAWGKFLGAVVFSIAVLLISLVGGELFTGNGIRRLRQECILGGCRQGMAGKLPWQFRWMCNYGASFCRSRCIRLSRLFRRLY